MTHFVRVEATRSVTGAECATPPSPSVSAIVVTWRRPVMAEQTVRSLLRQHPCPRVVVVDNAPELEGAEHIRRLATSVQGSTIEVIELAGNRGFAGGLAAGMQHALDHHDPDWLWLLDDDSPVGDGSLERALGTLSTLPNDAVLGNRGALIRWGRIVKVDAREFCDVTPVPLILADGALYSADAVRRVGLPRPELFFMFEDFEYALRLGRAGVPMFVGSAVASDAQYLGSTDVTHPWRAYYQTRNHLRAALDARSVTLFYGWATRPARQILTLLVARPDHWRETIHCRVSGTVDGFRNRLGKRLDPAAEPTLDHLAVPSEGGAAG